MFREKEGNENKSKTLNRIKLYVWILIKVFFLRKEGVSLTNVSKNVSCLNQQILENIRFI